MNPYVFGEKLASKLTVDLPFSPDRPEAWVEVANVEPRFTIHPRGWPIYHAQHDIYNNKVVLKLSAGAEPGIPHQRWATGNTHVHPGKGLISALISRR